MREFHIVKDADRIRDVAVVLLIRGLILFFLLAFYIYKYIFYIFCRWILVSVNLVFEYGVYSH